MAGDYDSIDSPDSGLGLLLNEKPCNLDFNALFGVDIITCDDSSVQDMEIDKINHENVNENDGVISSTNSCETNIDDLVSEVLESLNNDANNCVDTDVLPGLDYDGLPDLIIDNKVKLQLIVPERDANAVLDLFKIFNYDAADSTLCRIDEELKKATIELKNEQTRHLQTKKALERRIEKELKKAEIELKNEQTRHLQTRKALEQTEVNLKKKKEMKRSTCSCSFNSKRINLDKGEDNGQIQGSDINSNLSIKDLDNIIGKILFKKEKEDIGVTTGCIEAGPSGGSSVKEEKKVSFSINLDSDSGREMMKFVQENELFFLFEDMTGKKRNLKLARKFSSFKEKNPSNFSSVISKVLVNFMNGEVTANNGIPDLSISLRGEVLKLLPVSTLDQISKFVRLSSVYKGVVIHPFASEIRARRLRLRKQGHEFWLLKKILRKLK